MGNMLPLFLLFFSFVRTQYVLPDVSSWAWCNGFNPVVRDSRSYPFPDTADPARMAWAYVRETNTSIEYILPLADFTRIQFQISSEFLLSNIGIFVTDIDGAVFVSNVILGDQDPDVYVSVDITPASFSLAPSSPVFKASLDASLLRRGLVLYDTVADVVPDSKWNVARVTSLDVEYAPFDQTLASITVLPGQVMTLESQSIHVSGFVHVYGDGRLIVRDVSRFYVTGGGYAYGPGAEFVLERSLFVSPQVFNHQYTFDLVNGGKWTNVNSTMALFQQFRVTMTNGSVYDAKNVFVSSGIQTVGLGERIGDDPIVANDLYLDTVHQFGEIMLNPGSTLIANHVSGYFTLWHVLPEGDAGTISFPSHALDYTSDPGLPYSATVTDAASAIEFALIVKKGATAVIDNSEIFVVAMFFESYAFVNGLHGDQVFDDRTFATGDMNLRLTGGTFVKTFSLYSSRFDESTPEFQVDVFGCVFGEGMGWGSGKMMIQNSTCDGTGGYVAARQTSEVTLWYSEINSNVISHDEGIIRLYGCTVNGGVFAEGTIYINGSVVNGPVVEEPGGRIIYGPLIGSPPGLPDPSPDPDPDVHPQQEPPIIIAIIVGAVVGSLLMLVVVFAVLILVVCLIARRLQKNEEVQRLDVALVTNTQGQ